MIEFLTQDQTYNLFGIGFLNDDVKNITYELRFPNSPRYSDPVSEWKEWKTHQIFPKFETLGPRDKEYKHGGQPGIYKIFFIKIKIIFEEFLIFKDIILKMNELHVF